MKKLLIVIAVVSLSQIAAAQTTTRFGIRGGLNIANEKLKASFMGQSASQSGDAIVSFHVGGMADIQLSDMFSIQPSLLLSGKGSDLQSDDGTGTGNTETAKIRPYYLELPVLLVVRTTLPNSNLSLFGGFGPSIGYGLFGKATSQGESTDVFGSDGFKRFDFGLDLAAGVELPSGLQFSFHYTPGLANIAPDSGDPDLSLTVKNTVIGFSIGYFFNQNN
jgi:hypothetical protein